MSTILLNPDIFQIWVQLLTNLDKLLSILEEHREVHFIEGMPEEQENLEVGFNIYIICVKKKTHSISYLPNWPDH